MRSVTRALASCGSRSACIYSPEGRVGVRGGGVGCGVQRSRAAEGGDAFVGERCGMWGASVSGGRGSLAKRAIASNPCAHEHAAAVIRGERNRTGRDGGRAEVVGREAGSVCRGVHRAAR